MMLAIVLAAVVPAKAESWTAIGKLMATELNGMAGEMQSAYAQQGLDTKITSAFTTSTKSLDITIDFKELDLVPYLNAEALQSSKDAFIDSFVESSIESSGEDEMKIMVNTMIKDGGTIKMIFKGAGKSKSISITGQDIKKVAANKYGVRF